MKSHYNLRSRDGSHGNKSGRKEANGNTPAYTTDSSSKGEERSDSGSMQAVVFVTLIVDLLAFTMILPLLPSLLDYYSQNDKTGLFLRMQSSVDSFRNLLGIPDTEKNNSVLFGGIIGSLFSFLQFLASPVIGAASDKYGRRPLMIITTVGIAISYAVWALSYNFPLFVLARIIGGISKGNVSLSTTIVTDISSTKNRGRGMILLQAGTRKEALLTYQIRKLVEALIGMAFSVGFIIGPMIGAYFARGSSFQADTLVNKPAILALSLALLDILLVVLFLKESLPADKRVSSFGNSLQSAQDLINPFSLFNFTAVQRATTKDKSIFRQIGLCYFLFLFIFSGLEFTLTFLVHHRFQYTSMQQGKMFVFIGVIMALVQGGYVRRIKPGKERSVALVGMFLLLPSFIIISLSHSQLPYYFGLTLFSFASATVVPCMTTVVTMYGSDDQKGTIMGIFRSLGALARAIGPILFSTVFWLIGATSSYIIGAACLLVPILLLKNIPLQKVV